MSTQTEHLKLDLREAADIFNPLSTNANFESLDNIIYEIQTKGGVPTYTTTASANLLKLSQNPTPNVTVFKFVAASDANTWSYQETVNDIVALDGSKKTVKGGEMYVAWVNAANAMVVIAWPDVVNAQTFDGKGPTEWASKAQLDAVNQTAVNATTTAQAAATVANQALEMAQKAGSKMVKVWSRSSEINLFTAELTNVPDTLKGFFIVFVSRVNSTYSYQRSNSLFIPVESFNNRYTMQVVDRTDDSAAPNIYSRDISSISKTRITFETGVRYSSWSAATGDGNSAMPVKIYALA